jgi:hypothetical protein
MTADQIATWLFAAIGVASALAAFLRSVLPYLRDFAQHTATNADNAVVEGLSLALNLLTMALEALHRIADAAGLNPPVSVKTAEEEKTP